MTPIREREHIGRAFSQAVALWPDHPFLVVPDRPDRAYAAAGETLTYAQAASRVAELVGLYGQAGYGHGHRVALDLENRPEHLLHKLALAAIGASCVPVGMDLRVGEAAYVLDHSGADLAITLPEREVALSQACALARRPPPVALLGATSLPPARRPPPREGPVGATSEASLLYTSGTTGRPKGCILSHGYELASGAWYAERGGLLTIRPGEERIYNPLPLSHVNASIVSFFCALVTGSCQIQSDRFHPQRWWGEIRRTRASVVHYLGVIVPLLLARPPGPEDRDHAVRFGLGAGVEPQLHARFEERFGFPLVEIWGMTEMVRFLTDNHPPRQVGTRAFGRPVPGVDVRVVDEADRDVAAGTPGELVVRHSCETPDRDCFSGYLDDPAATADAWRGGWFHTGDTVTQDPDGMLHFVDRKKNIIRRSGENIAAAEVEAVLQAHEDVLQVAVLAVPDEVREEEVLACIVLARGTPGEAAARRLFAHVDATLAYFKAPGWIWFTDTLPTTGTQKLQKHAIFPKGLDPRTLPGMIDLRGMKKRG